MTPPPPQAALIGAALAWNLHRSTHGKRTISRWACEHKPAATAFAGWLLIHWALYVID